MPIRKDGTIEYNIPDNIYHLISPEFCSQFLKELHIIFGVGIDDTDMDYFVHHGGTTGWAVAFAMACRKLGLDELYKHYVELEWYDSDIFDGELEDILVEHKLVVGGFISDEIARQNKMSKDEVVMCDHCGRYFHKNDIEKVSVHYEGNDEMELDDFDEVELVCLSCLEKSKVSELTWSRERTIKEILGESPADFFVCEKCGKTHYLTHRGKKYCMHCEQELKPDGPGSYYRKMLKEKEKYKDKVFGRASDSTVE